MIEVHPNPDQALSDGAQSLTPKNFAVLVEKTAKVAAALGRGLAPHAEISEEKAQRKAS